MKKILTTIPFTALLLIGGIQNLNAAAAASNEQPQATTPTQKPVIPQIATATVTNPAQEEQPLARITTLDAETAARHKQFAADRQKHAEELEQSGKNFDYIEKEIKKAIAELDAMDS